MKFIILDRDGVINYDSPNYIKSPDEWIIIPNSLEAIVNLTKAGYTITVCSNQSALGRGLITLETLNAIHKKMLDTIEAAGGRIADICFCPHVPEDWCSCRKPLSKMIYDLCSRFGIDDTTKVIMVGDSLRDLQAIANAHGIPVLVKTGNGEKTLDSKIPPHTLVFDDLLAVSNYLLTKDMAN